MRMFGYTIACRPLDRAQAIADRQRGLHIHQIMTLLGKPPPWIVGPCGVATSLPDMLWEDEWAEQMLAREEP